MRDNINNINPITYTKKDMQVSHGLFQSTSNSLADISKTDK